MLNQFLTLTRPLACIDCETTGLDPNVDRIIQLQVTMHYPDKDPVSWGSLVDPEIPILNDQHGITDSHIKEASAPPFKKFAEELHRSMIDIDICAYNGNFDVDFVRAEFKRAGITWAWKEHLIDPLQIYKARRGHTLSNCFLEFGGEDGSPLPPNTPIENAHDATFDVHMMTVALRGQLLRFPHLPRTVKELSEACFPDFVDKSGKFKWTETGDVILTFGKFRGKSIKDPSVRGYLSWMKDQNFSTEVKEICEDAVLGIFPERKV